MMVVSLDLKGLLVSEWSFGLKFGSDKKERIQQVSY